MSRPRLPRVVLDTNVCLDLFVFNEPQAAALRVAIQERRIEAVTRADCRAEWLRVLHYPGLPIDDGNREGFAVAFDTWVRCLPDDPAYDGTALPRCADPDDQMFLELADAAGAHWLVSKDNHLLSLAARCARDGRFVICLPQAWSMPR